MRRLIAAMKISIDGKYEGAQGYADWVDGWSDDYGLASEIDACVLGGPMYQGYEPYWTTIQQAPTEVHSERDERFTAAELEWAEVAKRLPHYVVSRSAQTAEWPNTRFIRSLDDVAALKKQEGKDIYLMGGGGLVSAALEAGLVDEMRLIVYPLLAGEGPALFANANSRRPMTLEKSEQLPDGRLSLVYGIGSV